MTAFLFYIGRAGLYLALFYVFYLLVMRRTTFFRLNRVLLLAGSYLCLVLPFIRLRGETATVVEVYGLTMVAVGGEPTGASSFVFPWREVLLALYIAGAVVTAVLFLVSFRKMGRLIRSGEAVSQDGCRLVLLEPVVPSFSWGRTVVMSRKDLEENPAIYTHEMMHVKCRHSLDLIVLLPVQLLFWWNPLVWIMRQELRLLHEYEADEGVIKEGIDATRYQLLLVRKAVGEQSFSMASGFQHTKLKNRIAMMSKPVSSGWMRWSYLALIPVLAAFMFACNNPRNKKAVEEPAAQEAVAAEAEEAVPFSDIERKPTFAGGDANSFAAWVAGQIKYPEKAKNDKVQGRVMIQFTIGSDGAVTDPVVLRGLSEEIDAEALRVIALSPQWTPGYDASGKAVPVTFTIPVVFKLQ